MLWGGFKIISIQTNEFALALGGRVRGGGWFYRQDLRDPERNCLST